MGFISTDTLFKWGLCGCCRTDHYFLFDAVIILGQTERRAVRTLRRREISSPLVFIASSLHFSPYAYLLFLPTSVLCHSPLNLALHKRGRRKWVEEENQSWPQLCLFAKVATDLCDMLGSHDEKLVMSICVFTPMHSQTLFLMFWRLYLK